jgi:hypothetical protein
VYAEHPDQLRAPPTARALVSCICLFDGANPLAKRRSLWQEGQSE